MATAIQIQTITATTMATKKKTKKLIAKLAATMPVITRTVHEDHIVKGTELIAQGHTEIEPGVPVDPEKTYVQQMPVIIARNHEKRIKEHLSKHGREGVDHYINNVKSVIKHHEDAQ